MAKAKDGKTPESKPRSRRTKVPSMEVLKQWVRSEGMEYLKRPDITSVGIGYKQTGGVTTDQVSIQFTVGQKAAPEVLEAAGIPEIPKTIEIDGVEVPTDVLQRRYAVEYHIVSEKSTAKDERKRRLDPIVPGISVANHHETAGTIGCIVYDAADGRPFILSNWHVLHGSLGAVGDDIVQPGPFDDNAVATNRLGRLVRSHLGPAGDCAVSTIEDRGFAPEVCELGLRVERLGEAELGDTVIKSGRTTGVTRGRVTRVHTVSRIDYGEGVGEVEVGGIEIGVDPAHTPADGEISKGGDSGSVWLFTDGDGAPTTVMAGLHFAGETDGDPNEHALACYPKSVFEKLAILLSPPAIAPDAVQTGYAPDFLNVRVAVPTLTPSQRAKVVELDGNEVIAYTHFSLALNRERRFAFWVAWNIDGGGLIKLSRKDIPFLLDPRVPEEAQAGNDLYAGNQLDRGHIARRADLLWGGPAEAKRANRDSFYFTNITPQMDDFNQSGLGGIWGKLEDAVFDEVDIDNLRVSVFGGPVFRDDDRPYRSVKIPREFWKVLAFVEGETLRARGFLLTQSLDGLEALDLATFKVYQVALAEIEARCGLRFPARLKAADSMTERLAEHPEGLIERRPLASLADIAWS